LNTAVLPLSIAALGLALASFEGTAAAQTFPTDDKWSPLPCGGGVMVDGYQDQSGAIGERDIVGDVVTAAGYHASDATFAYLRLRVERDPTSAKKLQPFEWGFELDLDGNHSTYEVLIILRGNDATIAVQRNTVTTLPDDPKDPADDPPIATFPFATHGRSIVANASRYGGDDDFFVDLAIPWATLEPLGVTRTAPLAVWAATSTSTSSLDGDFACHDGASGPPKLSTIAPPPTTLDPTVDTDKDGWTDAVEVTAGTDPKNAASHPAGTPPPIGGAASDPALEGAGGCKCTLGAGGNETFGFLASMALLGMLARRRR
jgi:hypothetical protein